MRLLCDNRVLTRKQPKTILTAAPSAAATSITVKNNAGFSQNDYVLIGNIGEEKAEIKRITATVSAGNSLTVSALTFDHDIDEPVTKIDYDQVAFYHGTTTTASSSTLLATQDIDPTETFSYYEDTTNATGYGFCRFYDSNGGTYSIYSDAIPYTGYTKWMLRSIRKVVRKLLNEPDESLITDDDIDAEINLAQQHIAGLRLWSFYEKTASFSSVANQYEYSLASDVQRLYEAKYDTQPLVVIDLRRWNILRWDTFTTGDPTHITMWRNKARVYPYPSSSADTTTLSADITSSDTTITVSSTADFQKQGRILIDSEVISYTGKTSTTFTGCTRGEEGTTAASHSSGATVTERDFIYNFQEKPSDLVDETDTTAIIDPNTIAFLAAANLALGKKEDGALADRLLLRYKDALNQMIEIDQPKVLGSAIRVKDWTENVNDTGIIRDPNDFPENLQQV